MNGRGELQELLDYHRWATALTLEAVAELPPEAFTRDLGVSFGSVQGTLVHLLDTDAGWLATVRGDAVIPDDLVPADFPDVATLRGPWRETLEGWERVLAERDGGAAIEYGRPERRRRNTVAEITRHVVNHGTYHRGQVAAMMRQLGAQPVSTDLIYFYRERG